MEPLRESEKEQNQNWLKAIEALSCLQKPLERFIDEENGSFHQKLVVKCGANLCVQNCNFNNWKPQQNQSHPLCEVCSSWRDSIEANRTSGKLMWVNSKPDRWSQDQWEVAKVYMPHGHKNHHSIGDFDIAALLCLMNQCQHFKEFELGGLCNKVIRFRNELMHSCEFRVKDEWMRHYQTSVRKLVRHLDQVPQMATAGKQIEEMLSLDLSICVSGLDRMDSAALDGLESDSVHQWKTSASLISQWEAELLQERLQELLHSADDDAKTQDTEQLKRLGGFLQANRDLGERFSAELQAINALEARE